MGVVLPATTDPASMHVSFWARAHVVVLDRKGAEVHPKNAGDHGHEGKAHGQDGHHHVQRDQLVAPARGRVGFT